MLVAQCQQLDQLQKKAGIIKSKTILESNKALEAKVTMLEAKTDGSSNESFFTDEKPNANNRKKNSPWQKKRAAEDRATQTLVGQGCQKGTVSQAC